MDILKEQIDKLNAKLKIKVEPKDYKAGYDSALKSYRKQMNLPGFRPGAVPMSVVKKKVGRYLLAEELNKVLNDSIYTYLKDNNIDVLGTPLPLQEGESGDWEKPDIFEFEYELGLAPAFETKVSSRDKIKYYKIQIDDKMVNDEVERMQKMYGKLEDAEVSSEGDIVKGLFEELDVEGMIVEEGIKNESSVGLNYIESDELKNKLTGIKLGDSITLNPFDITENHNELGRIFSITHEQVHDIKTNFRFTVSEIKHVEPSEINDEFFEKIYGQDGIKSLEEMKVKIREQLSQSYVTDSDRMFMRDASDYFIKKYKIALPDEFLKKWIQQSSEKPVTPEEIEKDYENYSKSLKWQLITNEMIKKFDIKVEEEEIRNEARELLIRNYSAYGYPTPEGDALEETVNRVLENQEEQKRLIDMIFDKKIMNFLKENMKIAEKDVSFEKFKDLAE